MMNKIVLTIGCCFFAAVLATNIFKPAHHDPLTTAAIDPLIENGSESIDHGKEWYISAKSLASYERKVILKLPEPFEF